MMNIKIERIDVESDNVTVRDLNDNNLYAFDGAIMRRLVSSDDLVHVGNKFTLSIDSYFCCSSLKLLADNLMASIDSFKFCPYCGSQKKFN